MSKDTLRFWPYAWLAGPMLFNLYRLVGRNGFQKLGTTAFWIDLAILLLAMVAFGLVMVGIFLAYRGFCRWFDRSIDRARSRAIDRIAARDGKLTWPASDPLHDPEIDG